MSTNYFTTKHNYIKSQLHYGQELLKSLIKYCLARENILNLKGSILAQIVGCFLTVHETKYRSTVQQRTPCSPQKYQVWVLILHTVGNVRILSHAYPPYSDSRIHYFSWRSGAPTRHSFPQHYSFGIASCSGYISPFYSFLPNTKSKYSSLTPKSTM